MQRAQGDALFNGGDDLVVDDAGVEEFHAAVQNPVAHGIDLIGGGDDTVHGVHENGQNRLDGLGVGGHGDILHDLLTMGVVGQTAVNVDPLAKTLGGHIAGIGVHELVLQTGRAGVDNKNIHSGVAS